LTPVFNELNKVINDAIKRGDSPGDLITALTSCVIGVINCLKVAPDIKKELSKQAAGMIQAEVK
jgi:hypothetical protein